MHAVLARHWVDYNSVFCSVRASIQTTKASRQVQNVDSLSTRETATATTITTTKDVRTMAVTAAPRLWLVVKSARSTAVRSVVNRGGDVLGVNRGGVVLDWTMSCFKCEGVCVWFFVGSSCFVHNCTHLVVRELMNDCFGCSHFDVLFQFTSIQFVLVVHTLMFSNYSSSG